VIQDPVGFPWDTMWECESARSTTSTTSSHSKETFFKNILKCKIKYLTPIAGLGDAAGGPLGRMSSSPCVRVAHKFIVRPVLRATNTLRAGCAEARIHHGSEMAVMFYREMPPADPRPPHERDTFSYTSSYLKPLAGGRPEPPTSMFVLKTQRANGAPDLSRTTGWPFFLGLTTYGSHK